jgi:tight adherence protein B
MAAVLRGSSAVAVLAAAGVAAAALTAVGRVRESRTRAARRRDVVTLTHALASELRAGRAAAPALRAAADQLTELAAPLRMAAHAAAMGADAADELRDLASTDGCERLRAVAAAWEVMAAAGAPVAAVLDDLGAAYTADDELSAEIDALLAGPRSTVVVLALLPVAALALATTLGARPVQVLLHTRLGLALAGAAVLLELAGLSWMRAIVRWALRDAT